MRGGLPNEYAMSTGGRGGQKRPKMGGRPLYTVPKTKLMKRNDEHFFMFPKIMQKCSKLYAFSLIIDLKISGKYPFLLPHHSYLETLTKLETTYKPHTNHPKDPIFLVMGHLSHLTQPIWRP